MMVSIKLHAVNVDDNDQCVNVLLYYSIAQRLLPTVQDRQQTPVMPEALTSFSPIVPDGMVSQYLSVYAMF